MRAQTATSLILKRYAFQLPHSPTFFRTFLLCCLARISIQVYSIAAIYQVFRSLHHYSRQHNFAYVSHKKSLQHPRKAARMFREIVLVNCLLHLGIMATFLPLSTISLFSASLFRSCSAAACALIVIRSLPLFSRPCRLQNPTTVLVVLAVQIYCFSETYGLLLAELADKNWSGFNSGFLLGLGQATRLMWY